MLPISVRMFDGSLENFKSLLDHYIAQCPDQPATEDLIPQAKDIYGDPSNSLMDWMRTRKFVDPQDDLVMIDSAVKAQP